MCARSNRNQKPSLPPPLVLENKNTSFSLLASREERDSTGPCSAQRLGRALPKQKSLLARLLLQTSKGDRPRLWTKKPPSRSFRDASRGSQHQKKRTETSQHELTNHDHGTWVAFSSAIWRGGCTAAKRAGPTSLKLTSSFRRSVFPFPLQQPPLQLPVPFDLKKADGCG